MRPPFGEIKIIVGGMSTRSLFKTKKTYLREVQNVQISKRLPRMIKDDEPAVIFTDEDARRLHHPHDDAIVITLTIANYTTRRVKNFVSGHNFLEQSLLNACATCV